MPRSGSGPPAGALYLFCLTAGSGPWTDLGEGLLGTRVLALSFGNVTAIAATVDRSEFCGPAAEERSQDPAWLGPRAMRHLAVIQQVMSRGPVVPARFATLFSSPEALGDTVAERREAILAALERVRDRQEWSIKGILVSPRIRPRPADAVAAGPVSGLGYLEQRQRQIHRGQACREDAERVRADLEHRFAALAEVTSRSSTAAVPDLAFELALLVPTAALSTLQSQAAAAQPTCAAAGLKLVLSGPWPPYSFCSLT